MSSKYQWLTFILKTLLFNCHFDAHLLQSSHFIKSIILNNIEHMYNTSHHDDKVIPKIIQTFYKEAVIRHPHIYIPKIPVEQHILINILTFIHDHITSIFLYKILQHMYLFLSHIVQIYLYVY